MLNLLSALFLALPVPAASAATAPDLGRAVAQAVERVKLSRAALDIPNERSTPDADSDIEPLEALGNFAEVSPGLYRSAQPSRVGYKQLKKMGVRTILTLKDNLGREREEAGAEGLAVEGVPMSGFAAPSFEQVDRALAIMTDPAKRPLLVHCQFGKDRSGFVVAAYRTVIEGMDDARAIAEAKSRGCCFVAFGDLAKFLRGYRAHRRTPKP